MRLVLAAGIGGLLIGAPAHSQVVPAASIVASDFAFKTSAGGAPSVTVGPGSPVAFSYPAGDSAHNVVFTGPQPSSCTLAGSGPGSAPLPAQPTARGWQGECTFAAEATYTFVCGLHGTMSGTVQVSGGGGAPPPPPGPPGPPPPPGAAPPPPPAGSAVAAASSVRITAVQRGTTIRGSVRVRHAGSRLLVRALARRRALSGGRSTRQVEVGRGLRRSVGAGRVAFGVRLNAAARRVLRRDRRLAISLRLTVTPPTGSSYSATRAVVVRRG